MSTIMDHESAERTRAAERYLLGECGPEDRDAFEAHFFECTICAESVRTGAIFADNARAVLTEDSASRAGLRHQRTGRVKGGWMEWLRGMIAIPVFAPALAALVLIGVVGYQNLVTIPNLRRPQVLSDLVLAPTARDGGPVVNIDRSRALFNLNFDVQALHPYPGYRCDFRKSNGTPVLQVASGPQESSAFSLGVLLPGSKFPDGSYSMTLTPSSDPSTTIHRYTFTVQSGETH